MTKWRNDISPARDKLDAHLVQHVYRNQNPLRLVSPDPMNNTEAPDVSAYMAPVDRDHAPLDIVQGVEVHRMPAEASTDIGAEPEPDKITRTGWQIAAIWAASAAVVVGLCFALRGVWHELPRWTP